MLLNIHPVHRRTKVLLLADGLEGEVVGSVVQWHGKLTVSG